MKYKYNNEHEVTYSEVDKNINLSLLHSIMLAQDMMTKYFKTIGSDNYTTKMKDNSVWVVSKARILINKFPRWLDVLKEESYTTQKKLARVELETIFKDKKDNMLFIVNHESCPVDLTTKRIRKINSISYPSDMELEESMQNKEFSKLNTFFSDRDICYSFNVKSSDIDFSDHVNNAIYVRYIMDAFTSDYWNHNLIKNFEIHYIKEAKEDQSLTIYKKELEDGIIDVLIKSDQCEIVRARIEYIKRV